MGVLRGEFYRKALVFSVISIANQCNVNVLSKERVRYLLGTEGKGDVWLADGAGQGGLPEVSGLLRQLLRVYKAADVNAI
jgi:hypothetical protein